MSANDLAGIGMVLFLALVALTYWWLGEDSPGNRA
jgi:hypothetical protein